MSRNAEDCENSGSLPQLESEPEVEQIGEAPEEVPFEIPKKWKWMNFDCVVKTFPSKNYQIQTKEIALEGKYPVISQAKAKIDGYCNDESKLIPRDKIPFVIFGDHTRVVKFVNRQCVIGADGTKLLRSDVYDISFLFYVIFFLAPNLREAGYSRHFKFLRARALPVPPLAEQRRIVARLNELLPLVDDFGEAQEAFTIAQTEFPGKLKASLLQAAIEGKLVPQLESEPEVEQISETPEDVPFTIPLKWKWATIGDSLQYGSSEQVNGQSIPRNAWVLDLEDIEKESGRLLIKKRNISNRSNKAKFKKGDVLYGKLRPYLNKCIIADEAGFSTTEIVAIRPKEGNYKFDAEYLKAFLMSPFFVNYANQASYGVKMPRLGTKDAKAAFIPVPPLAEQCRIVARLNKLLASINQLGD